MSRPSTKIINELSLMQSNALVEITDGFDEAHRQKNTTFYQASDIQIRKNQRNIQRCIEAGIPGFS